MQKIIQNCLNALKNNSGIIINYADDNFVLCDVKNEEIIKNTLTNFKSILVREDIYIEDYCGGVTEIVYDLIKFSQKNLFLQLTKLKNASEYLKIDTNFAMYHVPKDELINKLCKEYRKAIAILQLEKEFSNSFYRVNLPSLKNPFKPRAVIRLLENGEVTIIEK
ncbi:MAG: hypothetical protein ACK4ON_02275 [Bacteroidia bacterium]